MKIKEQLHKQQEKNLVRTYHLKNGLIISIDSQQIKSLMKWKKNLK